LERLSAGTGAARLIPKLSYVSPKTGSLLKVAVVADVRGWAFDNIAKNISITLRECANIEIFYSNEMSAHELFERIFIEAEYDHVHFLWREPYLQFFFDDEVCSNIISGLALDLNCGRTAVIDRLADGMGRVTQTFGVYDHVHLDKTSVYNRRAGLVFSDGYAVSSKKLLEIYRFAYGVDATVATPDGVDRALFRPRDLDRFSKTERPLVVGWVGNSAWHTEAGDDPKGLQTIVRPVIQQLVGEGMAVIADFADRQER
jgi:hypothetical protein